MPIINVDMDEFKTATTKDDVLTTSGLYTCCGLVVTYKNDFFSLAHISPDGFANQQNKLYQDINTSNINNDGIKSCQVFYGEHNASTLAQNVNNFIKDNFIRVNPNILIKVNKMVDNLYLDLIVDKNGARLDDTEYKIGLENLAMMQQQAQALRLESRVSFFDKKNISNENVQSVVMIKTSEYKDFELFINPKITSTDIEFIVKSEHRELSNQACGNIANSQMYTFADMKIDRKDFNDWLSENPNKLEILKLRLDDVIYYKMRAGKVVLTPGSCETNNLPLPFIYSKAQSSKASIIRKSHEQIKFFLECNIESINYDQINGAHIVMLKKYMSDSFYIFARPEVKEYNDDVFDIIINSSYKSPIKLFKTSGSFSNIYSVNNLKVNGEDIDIWLFKNQDCLDILAEKLGIIISKCITGNVSIDTQGNVTQNNLIENINTSHFKLM